MTEYREIVRRLQKSQSIRGIQRETGIHRTIIRKIKKYADKNGWSNPGAPLPSEESLYDIFGNSAIRNRHPLNSWQEKIREWLDKEYSYKMVSGVWKPK